MQLILVDSRLRRTRTVHVTARLAATTVMGVLTAIVCAVLALYALTFKIAVEVQVPLFSDLVSVLMRDEIARKEQFVRDNVSAMARRLGEMQAQLLRLDALGERVSKLSGIRPEEFNFKELPGRGGAVPDQGRALSLNELDTQLGIVARSVDARADYMNVIESELMAAQVRRALLPQNAPVVEGFIGSGYGSRADPFTGQLAMHAGVDFAAPVGTAIYAAAGGVVASAENHPVYGNTVKIDHGNELATLYAHASRILVKAGDIVRRGQKIAEVGSTGRSTGPHLHFEVHVKGVPQNPARFLAQQKPGSPLSPLAPPAAKAPAPSGAGLAQNSAAPK